MTKNITYLIYKIIFFFLKILEFIFKRRFSYVFKDIIVENSYEKIFLNNKKIYFFIPNTITKYRLDTFFSKEPKTLKWIQGFNKKSIFYDIGANVGNYSIFATIMNPSIKKVYAFEPSFLNTRVLARNISINKLDKKIIIIQLPLTNKKNQIQKMTETYFEEGGSFNTFGIDKMNKKLFQKTNNYSIFGTNIQEFIKNKILPIPNYIKIDVDGLENFILMGMGKYLKHKSIKSILIEAEEKSKFKKSLKILNRSGFKLSSSSGMNYIFKRKMK